LEPGAAAKDTTRPPAGGPVTAKQSPHADTASVQARTMVADSRSVTKPSEPQ
jgi:hypothetical protein